MTLDFNVSTLDFNVAMLALWTLLSCHDVGSQRRDIACWPFWNVASLAPTSRHWEIKPQERRDVEPECHNVAPNFYY